MADGLGDRAEAEGGEELPALLGDVLEEGLDELGPAGEVLAQLGVLRRDPDRAGVEVADAHHHAAGDDERRGREAELLGAEQRRHDHVPPGLDLAVDLDDDAVPEPVAQEGLLGLGQAELPGRAGVLERGERRGAGAAVVARDEHDVGVRLRDAGGDGADADLGHELHVDAGARVGVLQVVDELGEVLDRVDVVVRRRRDQPDAGRRVPRPGDPGIDLVARELAALAGLGALGDLDLEVVGVHEVLARDPEAARGHLLDGAAAQVAVRVRHVALGVLASLAGVRAAPEAVHRDRERLVSLGGDRPVGHRAGREALHDRLDRLDLLDRHAAAAPRPRRCAAAAGPARWRACSDWSSTRLAVLLEDVEALGPGGVLQLEHRLGVEEVVLALAAPLVLAADARSRAPPGPPRGPS